MKKKTVKHLVYIQYLGYRFHGWAKQKDAKTVHFFIDKTLDFVLGEGNFKTMGSSRTDAMVSANDSSFLLLTPNKLQPGFLIEFNQNCPPDIRATKVEGVSEDYNVLQPKSLKTYLYLFAHGEKSHPFSASMVTTILKPLDIELMKKGAKCFEGEHNFVSYITKPKANTQIIRRVEKCQIIRNTFYEASFFPAKTWALEITAAGFGRNQVRMIMAQLIELGLGNITLEILKQSLVKRASLPFKTIAPASGLILHRVEGA